MYCWCWDHTLVKERNHKWDCDASAEAKIRLQTLSSIYWWLPQMETVNGLHWYIFVRQQTMVDLHIANNTTLVQARVHISPISLYQQLFILQDMQVLHAMLLWKYLIRCACHPNPAQTLFMCMSIYQMDLRRSADYFDGDDKIRSHDIGLDQMCGF